jgi:uncharacterized protein (DUF2141 family)
MLADGILVLRKVTLARAALAIEPAAGVLTVEVDGVQGDRGEVVVAVYRNGEDYRRGQEPLRYDFLPVDGSRVRWVVGDLAPGGYVVMVYHDVNGNRRLDKNFLGFPTEPYGISNGVRAVLGPPPLDKARVHLNGEPLAVPIHLE